jgi:hypothetical protein
VLLVKAREDLEQAINKRLQKVLSFYTSWK